MRLVYTADLHGSASSYRALLDLAVAHGALAAVVGGDLLPHAIRRETAIATQRSFIEQQLRPLLEAFRATQPQIGIYLLPGNDDWAAAAAALQPLAAAGLVQLIHERAVALADGGAGLWLAGYACIPLTPFSIKDYERRDDGPLPPFDFGMAYASWEGAPRRVSAAELAGLPSIAEALEQLARQSDPARTIYVCHAPPANTVLDLMPGGRHVGSRALRAFIEQRQPPLTLHGHCHEAPQLSGRYAEQIGATWSVNPGHDQRRFQAVLVSLDAGAVVLEHTAYGPPPAD